MDDVAGHLNLLKERIARAAEAAGRRSADITLVAVSKMQPEGAVVAALAAGQTVFGENRVQEAAAKFARLRGSHPELRLHLIGPLQTNKVSDAVRLFDVIETLDRPRLAEALRDAFQSDKRRPDLFIEVNLGHEPQKAGIAPLDLPAFLDFCRGSCGLAIKGLMTLPPQAEPPQPYFIELRRLASLHGLKGLSMGMSADFEIAIASGATQVRVGTALFGKRPAAAP